MFILYIAMFGHMVNLIYFCVVILFKYLGILLWEIMTLGGTPYPSIAMPQLYNILKEGYRMEAPHNCPEEIYGVMVMCWQDKPEQRPQFHVRVKNKKYNT